MHNHSLAELQDRFLRALQNNSHDLSQNASGDILETPQFRGEQRLSVYRNNVRSAPMKSLQQTYPVCEKLVGNDYFRQIVNRYIKEAPSRTQDLNDYGETFAHYLENLIQEREEAKTLSYLPDVARLEWCIHLSSRAADDKSFDFENFATLSAQKDGNVCFILSASMHLLSSPYPVYAIWQAHQTEQNVHSIKLNTEVEERLLIWRKAYQMQIEPITNEQQWNLLQALARKENFRSILQAAHSEDEAGFITREIPRLIEMGWICSFSIPSADII